MTGTSRHLLAYFTETTIDFFIIPGLVGNVSTSTCLLHQNNHRLFHHYWSCRERLDIYWPILLNPPPTFSSLLVMPGTSRHLLAYFTEPTTGFFMPTLLKPPASHLLVTPGTSLHLLAYFIKKPPAFTV
jgi:hypothetical protein